MAKIMKKKNQLEKQYRLNLIGSIISYVGVITFWLLHIPLGIPLITMFGFLVCGLLAGYFTKKFKIISSGLKGEKNTIDLLSNLPNNCYVFNDIKIQAEGKESQLDSVVVSPYGVFIIETKNHNGEIVGDIEEKYWTQHKVGREGTPYQKNIYSPVKQVKTHTWRLSQFFKNNGLHVWVESVVYFSNNKAIVNIYNSSNSRVPVFTYSESHELLEFLLTKSKKKLSEEEIHKVIALLNYKSAKVS